MSILATLAALVTAASTLLPFPAPYKGPISADAKFASGPIVSIQRDGKQFVMNTLAGLFTVEVQPSSRILGVDAKPIVLTKALLPGNYVRVYFVLRDGPKLEELDLLPGRMR